MSPEVEDHLPPTGLQRLAYDSSHAVAACRLIVNRRFFVFVSTFEECKESGVIFMRQTAKRALSVILVAGLGSAGIGNAWGYFYNGADLLDFQRHYQQFRDDESYDTSKFFTYTGYVLGVFDRLESREKICAPSDVRGRDILDGVSQYLENTSGSWNEPASDVVTKALKKAYACQ